MLKSSTFSTDSQPDKNFQIQFFNLNAIKFQICRLFAGYVQAEKLNQT